MNDEEKRTCPLLNGEEIDLNNCYENCLIAESFINSNFYPPTNYSRDKAKEVCLSCNFHDLS